MALDRKGILAVTLTATVVTIVVIACQYPVKADSTVLISLHRDFTFLSGDSGTSAKPLVFVLKAETDGLPMDYGNPAPIIHADVGNASLWIKVRMPYAVYNAEAKGTVMWLGGYLTSVSYSASWQNNRTTQIYANTSNSGKSQADFSLTNIPYGEHQLRISASCVVSILDQYSPLTSHPFYDSTEKSMNFTVAPLQTPTPSLSPSPVTISILSPKNDSFFNVSIEGVGFQLTYATNSKLSWVGYSIGGKGYSIEGKGGGNVTVTENGTWVRDYGSSGYHTLTLYANDTSGNWATPQTVTYLVNFHTEITPSPPPSQTNTPTPTLKPDPTPNKTEDSFASLAIAAGLVIAVAVAGLLVMLAKRRGKKA